MNSKTYLSSFTKTLKTGGLCILAWTLYAELPAQADVVIGVAGPMTGTYAQFGAQMVRGAQLAVDNINARGGIAGEILTIETRDDECDNRKAEIVARDLADRNANVVIGHFCSNPALAAAQIYASAGIPMIATSASLPALTDAQLWNVVRISGRDDAQGEMAALRIAKEFPTGVVAVLTDGTPSSVALANRFRSNLGKAPALSLTFKPDAPNFDDLVAQLQARKIDVIYFACNPSDAGRIASVLTQAASLFGSDALLDDLYWAASGDAGAATHVTFATDPQSAAEAKPVLRDLRSAGFDGGGATIPAYAAVQLFAVAAQRSNAKNGKAIASYLRSGQAVPTVLGPLSFDAKGDVRPPRFVWYEWSSGAYHTETLVN